MYHTCDKDMDKVARMSQTVQIGHYTDNKKKCKKIVKNLSFVVLKDRFFLLADNMACSLQYMVCKEQIFCGAHITLLGGAFNESC
jgi:hypothetical protein